MINVNFQLTYAQQSTTIHYCIVNSSKLFPFNLIEWKDCANHDKNERKPLKQHSESVYGLLEDPSVQSIKYGKLSMTQLI